MPGNAFSLIGNVELNAGGAIRGANDLSNRFRTLSNNSRTTAQTLKVTAQAMNAAASAAEKERRSLSALAVAQERVNKLQRESRANAALTRARANAVVSDASGKAAIADGQRQLVLNRSLTETVRQRIAAEDAAGRAAERSARIASVAARDQIAQQRLLLAQEREVAKAQRFAAAQTAHATTNARAAVGGLSSTALHIGVLSGAAFVGLAANAVVMEREFANVIRTSDILDQHLSALGQQKAIDTLRLKFDALAQTLPISYKQLTEIGAAANQLGVQSKNVASFTKTVAQFSATTGVTVDTASTAFGRLDSLIPDVAHNYQGLADAINKVGVNSVATDQQIINIASQISGIAASAGLGYKSIIGFSGALASVAVSPYLARGLTTRLFTNITNAAADGGDSLIKFAQVAGVSAAQFKAAWEGTQSQKQGILLKLFEGIRKSGPDAVNVLKNLGVTSVLDVPALIRLANAADSTGKAGGLLAQTFRDSNTAAGENAKQYAVIASTLQSKLQVALNRTQILLRNIGSSNVGPLGAVIDSISNSVLRLSQNLDKPAKLLGSIQLPFKNGELLGFATLALGAVAAFTLLVGVSAKVVASFLAVRDGILVLRQLFAGTRATFGGYASAADAAAAANVRLAASQREVAATRAAATLASNRVTPSNSAFAQTSILQNYAATAKNAILTSNNRVVSSFANLGSKGVSALRSVASTARFVGGTLTNALFGPIGIGVAVAVAGAAALEKAIRSVGTQAGDSSVNILKATNALDLLRSTQVAKDQSGVGTLFGDRSTKSFVTNLKDFRSGLENLGSGGLISDTASKLHAFFTVGDDAPSSFSQITLGLDKLDAGFANLADSGNVDGAVEGIQNLFKGLTDQQVTNALAHMPGVVQALTTKLNENGITAGKNDVNIRSLARSNDILNTSAKGAADGAKAQAQAFGAVTQAGNDYLTNTKEAAAASIDLNAAFKGLGKNASLGDFFKAAKQQFQDFVNQSSNIATIAGTIGSKYVADLSKLDPGILALAVKTKGGMNKLKEALDRKDLLQGLQENFTKLDSDPKLLAAFSKLPVNLRKKISDTLSKGGGIEDAFRAAGQKGVDAFNSSVDNVDAKIKLQADPTALNDSLANISTKGAKALQLKITGDAGPAIKTGESAAEIISNLRAFIRTNADTVYALRAGESAADYVSRLKATLTVLGDANPAVDTSQSAANQIGQLQAMILINADPGGAKRSAEQAKTEIDQLTAQLQIDGDAQPAHVAGANASADISRLATRLVIDADGALAQSKGRNTAAAISRLQSIIKILGFDTPVRQKGESARAYIDRLKGTITILGNPSRANAATNSAVQHANNSRGTVNVGANTSDALRAINALTAPRTVNIYAKTIGGASVVNTAANKPHYASGGPVRGRGTGTSDSIPAMLSNGEYVVRAVQAAKHRGLLDAINYQAQGYATGGIVTGGSAKYNDTTVAAQTSFVQQVNSAHNAVAVTELSAYDRHLLKTIANNIGVSLEPQYIAQATNTTYRKQGQRGNG